MCFLLVARCRSSLCRARVTDRQYSSTRNQYQIEADATLHKPRCRQICRRHARWRTRRCIERDGGVDGRKKRAEREVAINHRGYEYVLYLRSIRR